MAETVGVREAAQLLEVHPNTVYKLLQSGTLGSIRLAGRGHYRIPVEQLDAVLQPSPSQPAEQVTS